MNFIWTQELTIIPFSATAFITFSYRICKLISHFIAVTLNSYEYIHPGKSIFLKHINATLKRNAKYLVISFHNMEKFYRMVAHHMIKLAHVNILFTIRPYSTEYIIKAL